MKIQFAVLLLLISSNFACQSSALRSERVEAKPMPTTNNSNTYDSNKSSPAPVEQSNADQFEAQNEKFRNVPEQFERIDFEKISYPYKFSYNERKLNFIPKDGRYQYDEQPSGGGWFNLSDIFYVDLTNDSEPEAIVIFWHVSCGGSCDGGAPLFYIYTLDQNKLKLLWQFEAGSLGYGCGLKSFTVRDKKITMELFGQCSDKMEDSSSNAKFQFKDTTRLTFGFNGSKFIEEKIEIIVVPNRNVMNYRPEVSINE